MVEAAVPWRDARSVGDDGMPSGVTRRRLLGAGGAAGLGIVSSALPAASAAASVANPIPTADSVAWTSGDLFDAWSASTSTSSDLGASNGLDWQVFFAHQSLSIASGIPEAYGIGTRTSGINSWVWYAAVSSSAATLGAFGTPLEVGRNATSGNTSYTSGGLNLGPSTGTLTVPAGRYFLIGLYGGPFYRAARTAADPRTGETSGSPAVTAVNVVYRRTANPQSIEVPSQLGGGGSGFTEYDGYSLVASVRFSVGV